MKQTGIRVVALFLGMSLAAPAVWALDGGLKAGDFVGVVGDSITEQTRYSVFIEDYLLMCKPAADLRVTQFGWSGERAPGFSARMQNDMVPFGCTVATTCYGMNDGGYGPNTEAKSKVYLDAEKSIIDQLKKANVRLIVLGSPGCVDSDTYHKDSKQAEIYNKTLGEFRDLDKKLAEEQGVVFADVYSPMLDVMAKAKAKYGAKYNLAGPDGIHPNLNGHLVMAYAFLKAMGCNGEIGTITVDMGASTAQGSDGHKIVSMKDGEVAVESTKYPFCFTGDPASPSATTGVLEFLPFNDDLNRFMLIVNNPKADRLKITWGKSSKEFSAADLKKGINLAAEFLDNPFSQPFADVNGRVSQQQQREIKLIKVRLHALGASSKPSTKAIDAAATADTRESILKEDQALCDASAAAVKPVTHTITIEAVK